VGRYAAGMGAVLRKWADFLGAPVDAAALGVVRIVLGAMIAWDALRFFAFGWIAEYYILPKWHFTYLYFGWVQPWPGNWMYVHFAALFLVAVLVAFGLYCRAASVALFLGYTYVFLLEKSAYMNHYYLIALLCFLMIWMQPHHAFALDRLRRPDLPTTVPRWNVLLLRFQLFIVYFYGAIAKLNPDWLAGEPMYSEIVRRAPDVPAIATHFPPALLAYAIAYGGILFDAAVPIALCFRRTRRFGFVMAAVFHLLNDLFLRIGVFSYLMTGAITIFFDPDWPRQLWRRWSGMPAPAAAPLPVPALSARRWAALAALHLYVLAQLVIPLRHWLYPGWVGWTEDGHRFSWHMKLRVKTGVMTITATDPATGRQWQIDPADDLRERQLMKLHTFPDMVLQYVHDKRDELRAQGIRHPIITVDWRCSLNGAPPQPLIDPTVNLADEAESIWPARWITRARPAAERAATR
jgi:vitamin K-dependent gamma-carboxylase